jgi:hypothetical protein
MKASTALGCISFLFQLQGFEFAQQSPTAPRSSGGCGPSSTGNSGGRSCSGKAPGPGCRPLFPRSRLCLHGKFREGAFIAERVHLARQRFDPEGDPVFGPLGDNPEFQKLRGWLSIPLLAFIYGQPASGKNCENHKDRPCLGFRQGRTVSLRSYLWD